MPRIDQMYVYIIEDRSPDDEGVMGVKTSLGWMPLVGADLERAKSYRSLAEATAKQLGKPVKLVLFTNRQELEVIGENDPAHIYD